MVMYLNVLRACDPEERGALIFEQSEARFQKHDSLYVRGARYDLLKTYVVNEETGELTEYKKPERLFCVAIHDWYELIDGNYIKLTPEQVEELRKENEGNARRLSAE